jgi:D-alanine-D-alanine ligase
MPPTREGGSIVRLRGLPQGGFIPVVYAATESRPDDALSAELAVAGALEGLGFTTEIVEVALDLAAIEALSSRPPLLVFNLVDAINCDGRFAPLVPARLDALGIAYTGCRTSALFETLSKVGTKLKLADAGLPTPEWSTDGTRLNRDARVIVKASWEHGSLGLDETSVMRCAEAPRVVAARTWRLQIEHFAEVYIEGREFHLALLERISGVEVLPIAEILFGGLEAHAPKIVGYDAKWTPDSAAYIGTLRRFGLEQDEPELAKMLKQFALASWTLFGFSGYARVDFRVDPTGAPFIIDVNPNPYLTPDTEDAAAAAEAGLSYRDLIGSIVESSLGAWQVSARHASQARIAYVRRKRLVARDTLNRKPRSQSAQRPRRCKISGTDGQST